MKKQLLAGLIMSGMVAGIAATSVQAEEIEAAAFWGGSSSSSKTATQTITATLCGLLDVTANGGNTAATINAETGRLSVPFSPQFLVKSNGQTQKCTLNAKVKTQSGEQSAFFSQDGKNYVLLANTDSCSVPNLSAINNAKMVSPSTSGNQNVIAYPITSLTLSNCATSTFNSAKNIHDISARAGNTDVTVNVGLTPRNNTYAFSEDSVGSYSATITLSSANF